MEKEKKIETYSYILGFIKNSLGNRKVTLYSEIVNLLFNNFEYMNWVGFYEKDEDKDELYLSIYVGNDACEIILVTKGVCGKCFMEQKTQLVPNVHKLPYHIACSSSTNSEIVVPIFGNNKCIAILDIDSDNFNAFDDVDKKYLEEIAKTISC